MDRSRIWPDFRQSWVVYEDEDILAIDKPVGVSCQAADPDRPDDLVTRLKRYLGARYASFEGNGAYLGIHQRLDRDTSGLLVYARRREANPGLAVQFEGRKVDKTYVACVSNWPADRAEATLRDALAADRDGRMRVVPSRTPGARTAVTRVRLTDRKGDRALLELSLDTGRTHQARVQLAHVGSPIAGDTLYGGAPAPRLMLHAAGLSLSHPVSGKPLALSATVPPELAQWLERGDLGEGVYGDDAALRRALDRALERRWGLGRSLDHAEPTTAFRLVNEEGDALPRLAIDVYDRWLVVQLHGDDGPWARPEVRGALLDRVHDLGFDGAYLKVRPKQANTVVDARGKDLAPPDPVRGEPAPEEFAILEEGVPLRVRLGDGLSTGLFLDQRPNRRRVQQMAAGKSVANLFAYTCAFTVVAARGGAVRTVSVDASAAALLRGRANLAEAGIPEGDDHVLVADDAIGWLARAAKKNERFDCVILDPPSYSTTHRGRFVAETDYTELAASALAIVAPGGRLLACTNHRGITLAWFRRILHDACRAARRRSAQMKDLSAGSDFPVAVDGHPAMKGVLVTLDD